MVCLAFWVGLVLQFGLSLQEVLQNTPELQDWPSFDMVQMVPRVSEQLHPHPNAPTVDLNAPILDDGLVCRHTVD